MRELERDRERGRREGKGGKKVGFHTQIIWGNLIYTVKKIYFILLQDFLEPLIYEGALAYPRRNCKKAIFSNIFDHRALFSDIPVNISCNSVPKNICKMQI